MDRKKAELLRSLKFLLFSISAGVVQIISFTLLFELLHLEEWVCNLISLCLSVLWNFTLNRKYTFHSAGNIPKAMVLTALYYLVFAPLSSWWTAALTGVVNEYIVEIGTMLVNFVLEYLYMRFFVFGKAIDTRPPKKKEEKETVTEYSCGAVVFTGEGAERRYVIIQSKEGIYGLPKGHIEAGETEQECALREILEETGLRVRLVDGFRTETSHPFRKNGEDRIKHVTYFLAEYEGQELCAQDSELDGIALMDFATAIYAIQYEDTRGVVTAAHHFLEER
jgi:8-oxo-dGTP pyrophosphatase MutT (NUDIX family)/putative flippase GtrA